MTNREIANQFNLLAKLMELHSANPFKIKSYSSAYLSLRKIEKPLADFTSEELQSFPGIGKSIVSKIEELLSTNTLTEIEELKSKTPEGIVDMLSIKGFGPKKIQAVWKQLGVESAGELLYACKENRLISLSGFGLKTQQNLINSLNYFIESKGKFLYSHCYDVAKNLEKTLQSLFPDEMVCLIGDIAKKNIIVESIEILTTLAVDNLSFSKLNIDTENEKLTLNGIVVIFTNCLKNEFYSQKFKLTSDQDFLNGFGDIKEQYDSENEIFREKGIHFIPSERRYNNNVLNIYKDNNPLLINDNDIKGVIHTHTLYSDGLHSVKDMALHSKSLGYEYVVITDHSKSAFYANGLSIERLEIQWREIDELNQQNLGIKIYKGIESDILNNGELDYEDHILAKFDMIIASVHSNLKMDIEKATTRLITAVENKYTTMLGHPTSRLLLSREGYPINYKKVIDACAANNVAIEINANPQRLDIDFEWIDYCMSKNVKLSINPDAHSKDAISHIQWGVAAAQKGGLAKEYCINSMPLTEFDQWINKY
jgi:DNA polymerase (family 10)